MRVVVDADADEKATEAILPWLDDDLGEEIEGRARRYAPRETGALAASVEHHMDGTTLIVSASGGDKGRTYAAYIELGHRVYHPSTGVVGPEWVPAEPFLRPALYGGSAHLRAKMFREDRVMQSRIEQERRIASRQRTEDYRRDLDKRLHEISQERLDAARAADARHAADIDRNRTEDLRAFSRDPVTGEKHYYSEGNWEHEEITRERELKDINKGREGASWFTDSKTGQQVQRPWTPLTREQYDRDLARRAEDAKRREATWLAEHDERPTEEFPF